MTELERWMNDHPPLADALTAEETAEEILKLIGTGNEEETGNAVMGSME